jgi:hypothetical protein
MGAIDGGAVGGEGEAVVSPLVSPLMVSVVAVNAKLLGD